MISEKATRLLMELSIYNEVEDELAKQNKLQMIPEDYSASMVVMHITWSATTRGGAYWNRIHDKLVNMEEDERALGILSD